MPKNMTISIPDSLFVALKNVKGEVPISRTCAIALQNAVDAVDSYAVAAKVRFACFSLEEAEQMAFEAGMKWAAEEAPVEIIIFTAYYGQDEELERYAEHSQGLREYMNTYDESDSYSDYLREEMIPYVPSQIISRFFNEDNDYKNILESFAEGVVSVWKRIKTYADSEVDGVSGPYIFKTTKDAV